MHTGLLNPPLYAALQARFGDVRIANAGQQRAARRVPDPMQRGRFTTVTDQRGEQYVLACPFCHDHKQRLYVSYMYGRHDSTAGSKNYWLWYCHNEKCHEHESNRRLFRSMTATPLSRRQHSAADRCAAATPAAPVSQEIVLPDGLIPIDALPMSHPAPAYLSQRHFALAELASTWGVSFCDSCSNCWPVATNRIVIPVYCPLQLFAPNVAAQPPKLAGWQARIWPGLSPLAGEDSKYLFPGGMQKSELLYGLHLASATRGPVYVVEGTSDCWRIGPGAVALFGKSLSHTQTLLLVHHFVGRPIVVMLDQDAREAALQAQRELALARSSLEGDTRVVIADVPAHRGDPADCTREEISDAASQALMSPIASQQVSIAQDCR